MVTPRTTKQILDYYKQGSAVPRFLSSFAVATAFDSEEIEVHVERDDEDVAVVLTSLADDPNWNENSRYTVHRLKPPPFKEAAKIPAAEVGLAAVAGQSPYDSPQFQANATRRATDVSQKLTNKLARAAEVQMAQAFTTGEITLTDEEGTARFSLDFQCDPTQFADADDNWEPGDDTIFPDEDLSTLIATLQGLGKSGITYNAVFGRTAIGGYLGNPNVQKKLDRRNMNLGEIFMPQIRGGGLYHGQTSVGPYIINIWSYPEFYKDPVTGLRLPYVPDEKVIVLADTFRATRAFGTVPRFPVEGRGLSYLPGRLTSADFAVSPVAWITPDGSALSVEVATRMLSYPVTINQFGCLTVSGLS